MNACDLVDKQLVQPVAFPGVLSPVYERRIDTVRDRKIYLHTSPLVKEGTFNETVYSENAGDVCLLPRLEPGSEGITFIGWTSSDITVSPANSYVHQASLRDGFVVPYIVAEAHLRPAFKYEAFKKNTSYPVLIGDIRTPGRAAKNTWSETSFIHEDNEDDPVERSFNVDDVLGSVANIEVLSFLVSNGYKLSADFTLESLLGCTDVDTHGHKATGTAVSKLYVDDKLVIDETFTKSFTFYSFLNHNLKAASAFAEDYEWWFPEKFTANIDIDDVQNLRLSVVIQCKDVEEARDDIHDAEITRPARARLYLTGLTLAPPDDSDD